MLAQYHPGINDAGVFFLKTCFPLILRQIPNSLISMKKNWLLIASLVTILAYWGCKQKNKNDYFPVISLINSQIKHVDTSLYSIIKIDKVDSTADTTYVKREEFRRLAHNFLETPDLTENSIGKKYKEEKFYDETMNRVILTYTPIKEKVDVLRQEIIITPDASGNDKVKSIIIEKINDARDSTIHQRLLWQVDESFQVVTIVEKNGQPVSTRTTEVIWNRQE